MPALSTAWPGWPSHSALILPLPVSRWSPPPAAVTIDGILFRPKRELHVTLIGRKLGQQIHADPGRVHYRMKAIRAAFARETWWYERSGLRYRLQRHETIAGEFGRDVGSIIERIDLPSMARFYRVLEDLLGYELPVPPPHVTLYTAGRAQGLCVSDAKSLAQLIVRDVSLGELRRQVTARTRLPARQARPQDAPPLRGKH